MFSYKDQNDQNIVLLYVNKKKSLNYSCKMFNEMYWKVLFLTKAYICEENLKRPEKILEFASQIQVPPGLRPRGGQINIYFEW